MADWKIKGIFKADADKVYKEISELSEVTPQQIYERGKDPESELHKCFEWDNDVCAEKWRLQQARQIIQLLVVTPRQEEEQPVRIFQISSERNEYKENSFFLQNEDEYKTLLKRAKEELQSFKRRYKMLSELEVIFDAIDEL